MSFFRIFTLIIRMLRFKTQILTLLLLQCSLIGALRAQSEWQQSMDYFIQVKLEDSTKSISGHIAITYTNNSPNTLSFIYIQLMPNAYLGKHSALNNQLLAHEEQSLQYARS